MRSQWRAVVLIPALLLASCSRASTGLPPSAQVNLVEPTHTQPPTRAVITETASPTPTEPSPPTSSPGTNENGADFQFFANNPVLTTSQNRDWDSVYIDPGAIVFHDGLFHMFFNGINGFPRPVGVGYATSPDGYHWTRQVTEPVLSALDLDPKGEFNNQNLFVTSALVEEDGTWVLYYYTLSGSSFIGHQEIGRATAPSPTGPWLLDPQPVLVPGPEGSWDNIQVSSPNVLRTQSGYVMYFDGMGDSSRIGMATSADGINWKKYDDPNTTEAEFAESDPVLTGNEGEWDATRVLDPNVVQTSDGWGMIYLSTTGSRKFTLGDFQFGYAASPDGLHWTKAKENPVLSSKDHPDWGATYLATLVQQEDTYFLYFDFVEKGKSGTKVYLATHEGSLDP